MIAKEIRKVYWVGDGKKDAEITFRWNDGEPLGWKFDGCSYNLMGKYSLDDWKFLKKVATAIEELVENL